MSLHDTKIATYADIEELPPHLVGEIVHGRLLVSARGRRPHLEIASRVNGLIGGPLLDQRRGPDSWILLGKPEVHLSGHVLVPDHAAWKAKTLVGKWDAAWFDDVPEWVLEIQTDMEFGNEVDTKKQVYADCGVDFMWIANHSRRALETYRRENGSWHLSRTFLESESVSAPPFDEITFPLDLLWRFNLPPATQEA
jgi:Uma2 family endonuclease